MIKARDLEDPAVRAAASAASAHARAVFEERFAAWGLLEKVFRVTPGVVGLLTFFVWKAHASTAFEEGNAIGAAIGVASASWLLVSPLRSLAFKMYVSLKNISSKELLAAASGNDANLSDVAVSHLARERTLERARTLVDIAYALRSDAARCASILRAVARSFPTEVLARIRPRERRQLVELLGAEKRQLRREARNVLSAGLCG